MKKLITLLSALVCVLALAECGIKKQAVPDAPNTMVPSIVYQGDLYRTTGKLIPAEVDESAIVGKISSVVPATQLPAKNGEANFGQIGDPYAKTIDGLLVIMDHEWVLFELDESA